jgi:hypothetical protein
VVLSEFLQASSGARFQSDVKDDPVQATRVYLRTREIVV